MCFGYGSFSQPFHEKRKVTHNRALMCTYLKVDYGQAVPVAPADDAVQVLELGGEEGPERALHADGTGLGEAQVVGPSDALHGACLRAVQGNQVKLCA